MGILEVLIIISWLIFPFGELLRINIAKDLVLHPLDISIFLILVVWIFSQIKAKKNIFKTKILLPIAVFFALGLFSLLFNSFWLKQNELVVSVLYLFRWVSYTAVYFAVRTLDEIFLKKILPKILISAGLVVLALGFLQLIYFPSLMSMQVYAWDKHLYRLFSVFLDPNYAGAFLVLFFIYFLTITFERLKFYKKSRTYFNLIILSFILLGIFLTFSRSALLMLLIAVSTYFVILKKRKLIFFLVLLISTFVLIASPKFYIENLNLFRVNSSLERINSAKIALEIFEKNPVIGVGFNAYRYAQIKYKFRTPNPNISSHADAGTDNGFLFVVTTTGVIGLIAYLYIWFVILKKSFKDINDKNRVYKACLISSVVGLMVSGQFNNTMFYGPMLFWTWTIIGITDSK